MSAATHGAHDVGTPTAAHSDAMARTKAAHTSSHTRVAAIVRLIARDSQSVDLYHRTSRTDPEPERFASCAPLVFEQLALGTKKDFLPAAEPELNYC